jgi:hypothetical protein
MDIEDYEFDDEDISVVDSTSDLDIIELSIGACFYLERRDVIALAKHFKLTVDDLNKD